MPCSSVAAFGRVDVHMRAMAVERMLPRPLVWPAKGTRRRGGRPPRARGAPMIVPIRLCLLSTRRTACHQRPRARAGQRSRRGSRRFSCCCSHSPPSRSSRTGGRCGHLRLHVRRRRGAMSARRRAPRRHSAGHDAAAAASEAMLTSVDLAAQRPQHSRSSSSRSRGTCSSRGRRGSARGRRLPFSPGPSDQALRSVRQAIEQRPPPGGDYLWMACSRAGSKPPRSRTMCAGCCRRTACCVGGPTQPSCRRSGRPMRQWRC